MCIHIRKDPESDQIWARARWLARGNPENCLHMHVLSCPCCMQLTLSLLTISAVSVLQSWSLCWILSAKNTRSKVLFLAIPPLESGRMSRGQEGWTHQPLLYHPHHPELQEGRRLIEKFRCFVSMRLESQITKLRLFYIMVSKRLYRLRVAGSSGLNQSFIQTWETPTAECGKRGCQPWWHSRITREAFKNPKARAK